MQIGGTEQVIRNLVQGLPSSEFSSSILCIDGKIGPWGKELQEQGVKHYCLERKPGLDLDLIKSIRKLLKKEHFDIIHCHQYTPYSYGWLGSILSGIPIIFTEHGRFYPDVSSPKRKLINPLLQLRTQSITAISAATKAALIEFENFSSSKIEVLYNGISDRSNSIESTQTTELKKALDIDSSDVVFGTISRLDPIKNHTMMLKSFKDAAEHCESIKLMIVGDGPEKASLTALTTELGISDKVIFTGFQANPQTYLSAMDVFLLPSLSEGTSMTLLEAMSFSKPSIVTSVGGNPEIVKHEHSGLLIENKDQIALSSAMQALSDNEQQRIVYGQNARSDYEQRFTLDAMIKEYSALYRRVKK